MTLSHSFLAVACLKRSFSVVKRHKNIIRSHDLLDLLTYSLVVKVFVKHLHGLVVVTGAAEAGRDSGVQFGRVFQ